MESTAAYNAPVHFIYAPPPYITSSANVTTSDATRRMLSGTFEHCMCGCQDLQEFKRVTIGVSMDSARDLGPLGPWNQGTLYRKWIGRYWFGYTTDAERQWSFRRMRSPAGTMYILWAGRRNYSFGIMDK